MKQNQKLFIVIGLGIVILLNVLLLGGLLTDFFSDPNEPGKTVEVTDYDEEITDEETTVKEEFTSRGGNDRGTNRRRNDTGGNDRGADRERGSVCSDRKKRDSYV